MLRKLGAVVVGVAAAMVVILLVEKIGGALYPPLPGLDFKDAAAMKAYVANLPAGALLFVLGGWVLGTLVGGWLAGFLAQSRPLLFAAIVGLTVLAGSFATMMSIPHPTWFMAATAVALPVTALLASRLVPRRSPG